MTMQIPSSVAHHDLVAALRPLLALLGVDEMSVLADPGITVVGDDVTVTVVGPVQTTAPVELISVGGDPEWAVQAARVTVKVDR